MITFEHIYSNKADENSQQKTEKRSVGSYIKVSPIPYCLNDLNVMGRWLLVHKFRKMSTFFPKHPKKKHKYSQLS